MLVLPTHFQPLPCNHDVRSRPRSQARSSPAASSPHPFPATPLHPRRPQPSAQPSSLIPSVFSPPISTHSLAPTPSAAVRAAKLAPLLPPISSHFCTPAVRSRPRNSPHPICRPQPSAQPSSLIPSGFFSPSISSHSLAPTPSASVRAIPPTRLPSASVRAAKLAHPQRLLPPIRFQPLLTFSFLSLPFPSFPFSFPFLSLAATPSAQHRSNQLAPPRS